MMIYIPYILTFVVSFFFMDVGILLVIINLSTITLPFLYQALPGIGGIQVSDFALMGVAAHLLLYKKLNLNRDKRIFIFICLWFLFIAILEILPGGKGISASYNMFIRMGLLWLVPVAIIAMSIEQRKRTLMYLIGCAVFITVMQGYAFYGHNPAFVVGAYYQFQNPDFFTNPEENMLDYYRAGILPRIYPSGALLVQMVMVFLLGVLFTKVKKSRWETVALFGSLVAFFAFSLSLRQRSAILGLFIAIVFLLAQLRNIKNRGRILLYIFLLFVAIFLGVSFCEKSLNYSFREELTARFHESLINAPNRLLDNGLAINVIFDSPLIGIGRTNVIEEARASGLNTLGRDVHPFLAVGLVAGVPFMLLVGRLIFYLYRRYRLGKKAPQDWVVIAMASAILYALFLAFVNTAPIFTDPKNAIPFLIFIGFFLAYSKRTVLH